MVADANKPTNAEIDAITDYFIKQFSKPAPVTQEETELVETESNPEITAIDIIETDSTLEEPQNKSAIAVPEDNQIVVSSADKQALVSTQSAALGFELSEQETIAIADNIDNVFADYSAFVTSVTSAIKGYIAHKFDEIEEKLDSSGNEVRNYLADRNFRLNQKLVDYTNNVKSIQSDTEEMRENLRTTKNIVLSRFQIK